MASLRPFRFIPPAILAVVALHAANAPKAPPAPSLVTTIPEHSIRLWEGAAPGALGDKPQDIPTLTPFPLPEGVKANGASIVVLPGGGYANLAAHEGPGYAEWFAQQGVTAYVLRYRLGSHGYHHPIELGDVARAVRMVRAWAKRDGLDPARIGVIGSSAGGHLASTIATHFDAGKADAADPYDRENSRPDLAILCYPVITFGEFAHAGSRTQLLGANPPADLVQLLSNELQVTKETPPCFIWHTTEDRTVPVENALLFASALRQHGVPFSLHIYEKGGHGLGMRPNAPPWADQLLYWLKERKFIP
jgi:acetyl esterase/lipase